jgi:hypothetical protein
VDVDEFVQWWCARSRTDIEWMVEALELTRETAGGTVCWIRAAHDVDVTLRRAGRLRQACQAAHRATIAALDACATTGVAAADRSAATLVARAAGDAARGLVAGEQTPGAETLLRPFFGGTVLSPA